MNRFSGRFAAMLITGLVALVALVAACGDDDGEDRPGSVDVIGGSGSGSASGSASGSVSGVSGSASASGISGPVNTDPSGAIGGYQPASDVEQHARVSLDVARINELLDADPIDFEAVREVYLEGGSSTNSSGNPRTLAGFARNADRTEPIWDDFVAHFDDEIWMHTFVLSALDATGPFEGESDAVRRQGVQKGIQNQIMVAWVLHEVVVAQAKVADGDIEPASGAPHNWDEGWAFYHGADPNGAPFATAAKRGDNFGTGSAVNDALLVAFEDGLQATLDGDEEALQAAADEVVRQLTITYTQATIRYANKVDAALADGDEESARVSQAEGWSFYRVIEPWVAAVDADAAADIASRYDLGAGPPQEGSAAVVEAAIESVYGGLNISSDDVGTLQ